MAHADILIYALIAVILLVRLWAVFGRRNDEDTQRPNPFTTPAAGSRHDEDAPFQLDRGRKDGPQLPFAPLLVAPASLLGALEQVKQLDPSFDEKRFLQDARAIFTAVVVGFAKGDLSEAAPMLGPSVLPGFQEAIAARVQKGETLETHLARLKDAETAAARLEGDSALVTVRFVSEQENILRDASGAVMSGAPGKTEEITDLWTFARDTKTPDAKWQVIETRS